MKIPFVGGAYEGRSRDINSQKCQNLFPVIDMVGGKEKIALMHTPGLTEYIDLGNTRQIRAMIKVLSVVPVLYVISGNKIFRVLSAVDSREMTGTLISDTGAVFMAHNGDYVMIVDALNGKGYYLDASDPFTTATLTLIEDVDFPEPSSLTFQDGYFIVTEKDTGKIYISPLNDPSGNWNALDFSTAEANPDYAYIVQSLNRELWIFGDETIEIFYNSGNADFPFERIPGSVRNKGIGGIKTVAISGSNDSIFFLGNDYSVYQGYGTNIKRISTDQIDYQIRTLQGQDEAYGFCYTQEGHSFYVISFPTNEDNITFVYDITTQMWHTRASGTTDNYHPVVCHSFFLRKNMVGHKDNGKLYYYDFNAFTDGGETLNRIRRTQSIYNEKKNAFHHILEVEFEAGVGVANLVWNELMINSLDRGSNFVGSNWANVDMNGFAEQATSLVGQPNGIGQYFTLPVANAPTTIGKNYSLEITYLVLSGGSGDASFDLKSFDGTQTLATLTATGTKTQTINFTATTTGGFRVVSGFTEGTVAFTNFSLTEIDETNSNTVGSNPQAMLRWSDDGGHTWSNEHWSGIGKIGEYNNRARWKKLGRSRDRIYEVKISDPVKVVMLGADLQYTIGQT